MDKIKLIDAIRNVERPEKSFDTWPIGAVCDSLGLESLSIDYPPPPLEKRLGCYPIFNWICTDEHVGLDALYLDGEPVGCAYRSARKSSYEIKWLSNRVAENVREVLLSYVAQPPEFDLIDPLEEIDQAQTVQFVSQALTDDGFFEGRPVKVLVRYDGLLGRTTPEEYRQEGRSYYVSVPFKALNNNCFLVQDGDTQRVISTQHFKIAINVK